MVSYKPVYKNLSRTFIGIIQNSCKDKLKLGNVGEVLKFRIFLHIGSSRLNVTMFMAGLRQDHYPLKGESID